VTLILDGAIFDRDEGGTLNAGEVQWMTAGSGIIHSEARLHKGGSSWANLSETDKSVLERS
jgi:redox-sensitive bicupin YhaK (pirin superfamily)